MALTMAICFLNATMVVSRTFTSKQIEKTGKGVSTSPLQASPLSVGNTVPPEPVTKAP